ELQLLVGKNTYFSLSSVLCLMETCLCGVIPDSALQLAGFQLFRKDQESEPLAGFYTTGDSADHRGFHRSICCQGDGGDIVNESGARGAACVLGLQANPYRLVLPSLFLTNARSHINKMDEMKLRIVSAKTDTCVVIVTETWLDNYIPDKAVELVGRSSSGGQDCSLAETQRQRTRPTTRTVQVWTEEASSALQDCFECTDWEVFKEGTDLDGYTSSVLSYLKFWPIALPVKELKKGIKLAKKQLATVPVSLKTSIIVPVNKKSAVTCLNVTLTPVIIMKCFESIVLLTNFYRATTECILCLSATVCYGSCTAQDRKDLARMMKTAQRDCGKSSSQT
ncbi:hypothetical protein L3Q82_010407, partial [Scortum barcoo]